jgi:hypothetical protein
MTSNLVGNGDSKVLANSLSHELYKGILAATDGCKASALCGVWTVRPLHPVTSGTLSGVAEPSGAQYNPK